MKFAHTRDDGLAGFLVRTDAEGRIFLSKTIQSERHLFLVSLRLGFNGLRNHRFRELHAFKDDRMFERAQRIASRNGLQTDSSSDVAAFHHLDFLTLVGVHLQQTTNAFLLILNRIQNGIAGIKHAGIHTKERELAHIRVRHDLESQGRERSIVACFTGDGLVVKIEALNRRNVRRSRQELNNSVKHALHTLVLKGGTAEHRLNFASDRTLTKTLDNFLFRQLAVLEVLVHQFFVGFRGAFDHLFTPFIGRIDEFGGDVFVRELHALRLIVPNDGLHLQEVHHAGKSIFRTNRNHDRNRIALQALLHLVIDLEEISAGTVHLVDEREAGHMVLVGLTPNRFRLGLHAAHSAVHHAGTVEHTHRAFHFDREVDVARGVNDVETIRRPLHFHAAPEAGRSSGGNRDAAFLFLFHPVHRRSAIMHFAELVAHARVEQNAFGSGGFARVNVGGNTDVAITRDRSLTSHLRFLSICCCTLPGFQNFVQPICGVRSGNARRPCWLQPYDGLHRAS